MDTTLLNQRRSQQRELEAVEARLAHTARALVRMLVDLDAFTMDAFDGLCDDIRGLKPQVDAMRAAVKDLNARIAAGE